MCNQGGVNVIHNLNEIIFDAVNYVIVWILILLLDGIKLKPEADILNVRVFLNYPDGGSTPCSRGV